MKRSAAIGRCLILIGLALVRPADAAPGPLSASDLKRALAKAAQSLIKAESAFSVTLASTSAG